MGIADFLRDWESWKKAPAYAEYRVDKKGKYLLLVLWDFELKIKYLGESGAEGSEDKGDDLE